MELIGNLIVFVTTELPVRIRLGPPLSFARARDKE